MRWSLLCFTLVACAPPDPDSARIYAFEEDRESVRSALHGLSTAARFTQDTDLERAAAELGLGLVLIRDGQTCPGCYELIPRNERVVELHASTELGVQYGLAHWLESLGYGFFHPNHTREPEHFPKKLSLTAAKYVPEIPRRGLHLHTLHPIEPMFDFWVPSDEHFEGAKATIDWLIRNRGNYIQWAALDDIRKDPAKAAQWRVHTNRILSYASERGVETGLTVQLFDNASLQQSYTLIDSARPDDEAALTERLRTVVDGVPFGNLNVSFGEFFGADPQAFIDKVDTTERLLSAIRPDASMSAVVHVGDTPELRVTYQGREQLYYFLVRYVNPRIIPRVHTVMFYNLFDSAGGAYQHRDFSEHREFLRERIERGVPASYYPESAYWVAFDNSVPTYLPVYLRSRFTDLAGIRALADTGFANLDEHLVFSSGWEWGYWQNDAMTLRMSYALPSKWSDGLDAALGPTAGDIARRLGEVQHRALIVEELAPWLAGRDQVIDAAATLGHIAAPDRLAFSALGADFGATLQKLETHALEVEALASEASPLRGDDAFLNEFVDGVEITAARTRFIWAVASAARAFNLGQPHDAFLQQAQDAFARGTRLAGQRRVGFHHPNPSLLVSDGSNPTFYDYGYLRDANTLCFWKRELAQVRNLVENAGLTVPGCVL
ncbi:MAG: hypothetical protein QM817_31255 [Archangium sp.]